MSDSQSKDLNEIIKSIDVVKATGFGEVRIIIRNGAIYRIQKIEDKLIIHK